MSILTKDDNELERQISEALVHAAQLAKDIAIQTNTGIVASKDGKVATITADELWADREHVTAVTEAQKLELDARYENYKTGRIETIDANEAIEKIRAKFN